MTPIEGVAVLLLMLVAWSVFTPNARLFGRVIGTGFSPAPKVAITFDDGPSPEHTPAVLEALRSAGARATFFVLGRNVRAHPELARMIVADGHELASHGDDHSLLVFAGPATIAHQFRAAEEAVSDASARRSRTCSAPRTATADRSSRRSHAGSATASSAGRARSSTPPGPASR